MYKLDDLYVIEVHPREDEEMKQVGTPFFWCILKWENTAWCNHRCGWESSIEKAFTTAHKKYNRL